MLKSTRSIVGSRGLDVSVALLVCLTAVALLPPGRLPYPPAAQFSDATLAHWPNAFFLRQSVWRAGQWPLWRPTEMLGAPFAANPLSKVWYPPQWFVLLPGLPVTLALNLLVYAHLVFGALGMLAWARAADLPDRAGVFGALAYALTPKVFAHLGAGHLDLVYAMAWAIWLWWAIRRFAGAPSSDHILLLGAIAGLLGLADLRLAAYVFGAGGLYAISLRWSWRALGLALLVASLLMAAYLVPLAALGPSLTRSAITPDEAGAFSLPPSYLLGLLVADRGGVHEWMTYLGLPALALSVLALRTQRREVRLLWGLVALAALYALGVHAPLYRGLVSTFPALTWLRIPSRAWFVLALAMACLSAYGAGSLFDSGMGRVGRLAAMGLVATGLSLLVGALVIDQPALLESGILLAATGIGLFVAAQQAARQWALLTLGTALYVSLVVLNATLIDARAESDVFRATASDLSVEGRVYSPSFDVLPHEAERAGLLTLHGVNPFQLTWSALAINEAAGVAADGYSITAPQLPQHPGAEVANASVDAAPDTELLAGLAVGTVIAEQPVITDGLQPIEPPAHAGSLFAYRVSEARPLAYLVDPTAAHNLALDEWNVLYGDVDVAALKPNSVQITVEAPADALLIVTQAWAPGWRANVDGETAAVMRAGHVLQGVAVSPGTHRVDLVYRPLPDFVGALISALTALALIARAWVRRMGRQP